MPKILITDPIAQDGIDMLSQEAEVIELLNPEKAARRSPASISAWTSLSSSRTAS